MLLVGKCPLYSLSNKTVWPTGKQEYTGYSLEQDAARDIAIRLYLYHFRIATCRGAAREPETGEMEGNKDSDCSTDQNRVEPMILNSVAAKV